MRKYNVIYADPPWPSPGGFAPNATYPAHYHYSCMKVDDIAGLPVNKITANDAVLFLWTTYRDLPNAINYVIPGWGFKYMTVAFHWLKLTSKDNPVKVMGYYFFNSTEVCLFATKGKPAKSLHAGLHVKVDSLIQERRVRHSQKPNEARERIDRLFPNCPKIELFTREKYANWDCWGNEVDSDPGVSKLFARHLAKE